MDGGQSIGLHGGYVDPVRRLLSLGEPESDLPAEWTDYVATFGFGDEHVAALIEMACNDALHASDSESDLVWAPVHARRALGQLQASTSVAPLLTLLKMLHDVVAVEDMPAVFGLIGPAAIPPLAAAVLDRSNPEMPASLALYGLKEIVARHPGCRDECVGILTRVLEPHASADPVVSGFAVSCLIDLHAKEAIDSIAAAFGRKAVDLSICGDLEEVEIELGLRAHRATPKPRFSALGKNWLIEARADRMPLDRDALPPLPKIGRNEPCPCGSGRSIRSVVCRSDVMVWRSRNDGEIDQSSKRLGAVFHGFDGSDRPVL